MKHRNLRVSTAALPQEQSSSSSCGFCRSLDLGQELGKITENDKNSKNDDDDDDDYYYYYYI